MSTKVNICVCVKNRQAVVKTTLNSILKQTTDDYVILACDDKSDDMTMSILMDYQNAYPGKVIAWQNENPGYVNCHNFILSKCDAEYICFIGSDDFVDEEKIAQQMKYLDEHPDVDVVSSCVMFPDKKVLANTIVALNNDQITKALESNYPMNTLCHFESCMFRRKCLEPFVNGKYFFDEYNTGRCGEGFLYTLHFLGYKFANIIDTVYVYTLGVVKDSMTNTIDPEFANTVDSIEYEHKKGVILDLFQTYNEKSKKKGRPKKTE